MTVITAHTQLPHDIDGEPFPTPVLHALADLRRDIAKVCTTQAPADADSVRIVLHRAPRAAESYLVCLEDTPPQTTDSTARPALAIYAADALGFVYGIYHISRSLLGITDFWFWNDQHIVPRAAIVVPTGYRSESAPYAVRYRGWFINDEVLINAWQVDGRSDLPWLMALEALLRLGGNMVIPGTDRNSRRYRPLAAARGLYITHHHAEPLGAEMFIRAYPDLQPSYARYPERFQALWRDAVREQLAAGSAVVWNLGFRGQGDYPFWHNDPSYDTDEKRGALVSDLIRLQYDVVRAADANAVCCTNLYGEVMELYQNGYLTLPDDVIKIWADNGFGKMVSRRQGNHNPRVPSLPTASDHGRKGIYYHVSFYDLQAANHITMLPNSAAFVVRELAQVLANGGTDYWIVNCSNVKPHVYLLDLVAMLWRHGTQTTVQTDKTTLATEERGAPHTATATQTAADAIAAAHRRSYARRYYGTAHADDIAALLAEYAACAPAYGPHEDDHAGEQFSNYVARMLVSQYMRNNAERAPQLLWATDAATLKEQTAWYERICTPAAESYRAYRERCQRLALTLAAESRADSANGDETRAAQTLLEDSVLLQARVHEHCYTGASLTCHALLAAFDGDYQRAFYLAGKARNAYTAANAALRAREHGKWRGFYANECFANCKLSARLLGAFMSYVRNLGEGPHFYQWQREFTYSSADRNVVTLLLWENHLTDDELFSAMEARLDDEPSALNAR